MIKIVGVNLFDDIYLYLIVEVSNKTLKHIGVVKCLIHNISLFG